MDNLTRHQRHYRKNREKILAKQKAKRQEPEEKARMQAYRDANKSRRKEYYEENKAVFLEKANARYAEKTEEILEKKKDRYWKDVEESRGKARDYRKNNPERRKEWDAKSYRKHRDKKIKCQSEYIRKRRKNDTTFRLLQNMRRRLSLAINDQGTMKIDTSLRLFGCSAEELKAHIESQFTDGMSWENYGIHGWHVDHIKPCNSFDFSLESEQRECFHYSNLQPLWAEDNIRKSDKN